MKPGQPLVTFVTVVYNGVSELEPTIKSIISQKGVAFEYFIIDGGSTDGTIDLIKKYESQLTGWISEKDRGLYDAMNKAMHMGTGAYFWFMNAGDQVHDTNTLEKIFLRNPNDNKGAIASRFTTAIPDVIYGETDILDATGKIIGSRRLKAPERLNWKSLKRGMVVCHQSFLVQREFCLPYNTHFRLAADIDWMIRTLKHTRYIYNAGFVLSKFKSGGYSQQNIRDGLKERFNIMVHYYGLVSTFYNHMLLSFRFLFYYLRHRRI